MTIDRALLFADLVNNRQLSFTEQEIDDIEMLAQAYRDSQSKLSEAEKRIKELEEDRKCMQCKEDYFTLRLCSKCGFKSFDKMKAEAKIAALEALIKERADRCIYCGDSECRVQRLEALIASKNDALRQVFNELDRLKVAYNHGLEKDVAPPDPDVISIGIAALDLALKATEPEVEK